MRSRRKREDLLADALPRELWPIPAVERLADADQNAFLSRRLAVDLWASGAPEKEIRLRTGTTTKQARRLAQRCLQINPVTRSPVGYHACVPGFRLFAGPRMRAKPFNERKLAEGKGLCGALADLFRRYPQIEAGMIAFVRKRLVDGRVGVNAITGKKLHDVFLSLCRAEGLHTRNEYPYPLKKKGYEAIARWYEKKRYERPVSSINNELGQTKANDASAAYFAANRTAIPAARLAYERVELDEHHFDALFSVINPFADLAAESEPIKARRVWALVLIETVTGAVLACRVSFSDRYSQDDVKLLVLQALAPPPRRKLRFENPEYRYLDQAAYPAELPEFQKNAWLELASDSDASHTAAATWKGIEQAVGCSICHERVGNHSARRFIERFFRVLSEAASWLPSATGNHSSSPSRRDPERAAIRLNIDTTLADELLDVLCRNHNATPNDACNGRTPLEMLREKALRGEAHISSTGELGAANLWALLPCRRAKLNRRASLGKLGPFYIELFGGRYTSPELANNHELTRQSDWGVRLYIQEDARYAFAVHEATNMFLGPVALRGKYADVPHTLEWRRITEQTQASKRMESRASAPNAMIGTLRSLASLASSRNRNAPASQASTILANTTSFMQRHMNGAVQFYELGANEYEALSEAAGSILNEELIELDQPDEPPEDGNLIF